MTQSPIRALFLVAFAALVAGVAYGQQAVFELPESPRERADRLGALLVSSADEIESLSKITERVHLVPGVKFGASEIRALAKLPSLVQLEIESSPVVIVPAIAQLKGLRSLRLSFCSGLNAASLERIAAIPNLEHVDISNCAGVTDEGVQAIASIKSLRELVVVGYPGLKGSFIPTLLSNPSLKKLDVSGSGINVEELNPLFALKPEVVFRDLTTFRASYCSALDDQCMSLLLARMPSLVELTLSGCTSIGDGAAAAISSEVIEIADLSRCSKLSDAGVETLSKLRSLRVLRVGKLPSSIAASSSQAQITDEAVKKLLKRKDLEELDLSYTSISTASLYRISKKLLSLKKLNISQFNYANQDERGSFGLTYLKDLPKLEELHLAGCPYRPAAFDNLTELNSLKRLNLGGCSKLDDRSLLYLAKLAGLQALVLDGTQVSDEGFAKLTQLKHLSFLSLARCGNIHGAAIGHLPQLRTFCLRGCELKKDVFNGLSSRHQLASIDLSECRGLDALDLKPMGRCKGLIRIRAWRSTLNSGFVSGLTAVKELQTLELRGCRIERAAVAEFAKLNQLTLLDLRESPFADPKALPQIRKELPKCRIAG